MRTFTFVFLFLLPVITLAQSSDISLEELYAGGPSAPVINYSGGNTGDWYQLQDLTFNWQLSSGVTAVAADVTLATGTEPMTTYRPPVSSVTLNADDLTEGTQYLTVQFRNSEKWGMYSEKVINVDSVAPESFSIKAEPFTNEGAVVSNDIVVSFEAKDALSGISHYELSVNGGQKMTVMSEDAKRGQFLQLDASNRYNISVTAFDKAGNTREESVFVLGVVSSPVNTHASESALIDNPAPLLVSVLAGMMLLMFGYMVYERQRYAEALSDLRRETGEIHEQSLRIFSALREEIYTQIGSLAKKARLTKKEKEVVDNLNKALSVSESLIEREIKDVKRLLD